METRHFVRFLPYHYDTHNRSSKLGRSSLSVVYVIYCSIDLYVTCNICGYVLKHTIRVLFFPIKMGLDMRYDFKLRRLKEIIRENPSVRKNLKT